MKIDRQLIQDLRDRTGLGMMDCKKALEQTNGDIEASIELLRKQGSLIAAKRSGRETRQGIVSAYIHPGDTLGVMVEINCETDFVANTADVRQFAKDICMHIAAAKPLFIHATEVDSAFLERERASLQEQAATSGLSQDSIDDSLKNIHRDICLLEQPFIKNDQKKVNDVLIELIAKTGENISIKRFARFEIGA